jgi:AcrR family transcriptional regulator
MASGENSGTERAHGPFELRVEAANPLDFARLLSGRHRLPREVMEQSQRLRLLAGAAASVGTRGYLASSVHQIIRSAGVGTKTFARHFENRDECIAAAYEMTVSWLEAEVSGAVPSPAPWPAQLQAATRRALELLDTDPRLARLCAVEIFLAGEPAQARHRALVDRWSLWLGVGRGERALGADLPLQLEPALIGGAISLIARQLAAGEPFGELAPELDEYLLSPYLGVRAARRLAAAGRQEVGQGK